MHMHFAGWAVRAIAVCAVACSIASPTFATQRTGTGSVTILRRLSISKTADLSFGRLHNQGPKGPTGTVTISAAPPTSRTGVNVQLTPNGGETPAIYSLSGEPNRAYRVSVPSSYPSTPGGLTVKSFTFWSTNSMTATGGGHFSASGTDTVRIGATMTVPAGTKQDTFVAKVPVTVTYD